jgi:hypothetical protein
MSAYGKLAMTIPLLVEKGLQSVADAVVEACEEIERLERDNEILRKSLRDCENRSA